MTKKILLLLLAFSASVVFSAPGKDIDFYHITLEDGLTNGFITSIVQDHRGFLWFGTLDGLHRYDGYTFKVFKRYPGDREGLGNNTIQTMELDRDGFLWIGTRCGLYRFDPVMESFSHIQAGSGPAGDLNQATIQSLCEGSAGILWIGTLGKGLHAFDREKEIFSCYRHQPRDPGSLGNDFVYALYRDRDDILWVGTRAGLDRFHGNIGTFSHYSYDKGPNLQGRKNFHTILAITQDRQGVMWLGTFGGLLKFDPQGIFTNFTGDFRGTGSLRLDYIQTIYEDSKCVLWLGTSLGGLKIFDREKKTFITYKEDSQNPRSLSDDSVNVIFEDRSGLLWAGTAEGISKFRVDRRQFDHYLVPPAFSYGVWSDRAVLAVLQDKQGFLWLGTRGSGLFTLDRETGVFQRYMSAPQIPGTISNPFVLSLCLDRSGILWAGTGGGLNKFDRVRKKFDSYKIDPGHPAFSKNASNIFTVILEDRQGRLWAGTQNNGLLEFHRDRGTFTAYKIIPGVPGSTGGHNIMALHEDGTGTLWVGTDRGLRRLPPGGRVFISYKNDPRDAGSLSHNFISTIYEDFSGVLWIGTRAGINRFYREENRFQAYTIREGLPNDTVHAILGDGRGSLWISTDKGLARFDTRNGTFKSFGTEAGLQGLVFNQGAAYRGHGGELFFGGDNGLNTFFPGKIRGNPFIPPVVITSFQLLSREYQRPGDIKKNAKLRLSYQDTLAMEFAALCYDDPRKNRYAYMIEGLHDDWVQLGDKHRVIFTNLPPGEFKLRVKGSNNDGQWNEDGATMSFTVIPPFWQTPWFRIFLVAAVLAVAYYWHRNRLDRLSRKMRTEAEVERFFLRYRVTEREREIICLILDGKSNKDIEDQLYISEGTVRNHIYNIYKKLGIKNRAQLVNLFKNLHFN